VPLLPIIPVSFAKDGRRFDFFSTVTTLGTPQDMTVQEIRIECFFPADEATAQAASALTQLAETRAHVASLVTHRYPLAQYQQALRAAARRSESGAMKVLLTRQA
jgi:threonine dehydrogenase-like Zn-dependent dehydrogenase